MEFNLKELICLLPIIWLFLFSLVPVGMKAFRNGKELPGFATLTWCLMGLLGSAGLTLSIVNGFWDMAGVNFLKIFSGMIVVDGIAIWTTYIIFVIVGFCLFLLYDSPATRDRQFSEHMFLILNSTVGMALLVMSNHLIMTFVAIELMSLSIYILIALNKEVTLSKESAFKYFVLGSMGSAIFLYGLAFIYGGAGTLSLQAVGTQASTLYETSSIFRFGTILTVLGFAFKVSLVPFHSWTPDVYQGAATPVTSVMSTAVKLASFVGFLRFFMYADFHLISTDQFFSFLQWLAAATMVVGNVAALRQENFKRMLAYSGVAHSGYAFVGLIAGVFGGDGDGGTASLLFYLFSYSVMTVGTFALVNAFERTENTILHISDLKGLGKKSPGLAFCLSLLLFSLAGLPPSVGFFGKVYIFAAAMEQGMIWLTFIGVLSSLLGLYYYLRPIVVMYMAEGEPVMENPTAVFSRTMVYFSAFCVALFGLFSSKVFEFVQNSVGASL